MEMLLQRNILSSLPTWASWWFGHRTSPQTKPSDKIIWLWSFVGAFCGVSVIQAVFEQAQYFIQRNVPGIIASYGASAVLIYGAIESPLAQPRALFGGHFLGALIGIIITKLFQLLPTEERFEQLNWLAGSLSCAVAIVVMQMTQTTHPPAGATALLAAVDKDVRAIGWYYLPVVLLSSTLAFSIALLNNNIQRKYPMFWFTPTTSPPAPTLPQPPITKITLNTGPSSDLTHSPDLIVIERKKTLSDLTSAV